MSDQWKSATWDGQAHAWYFMSGRKGNVASTRELLSGLNIDLDKDGNVLGIEVLLDDLNPPKYPWQAS